MATTDDPRELIETLRAWAREQPELPITVIPYPDTSSVTAGYIFQQSRQAEDLDAPAQAVWLLERRGLLELRCDGPHGALHAYPS
ncbi:MAG TPA: hypothetical protein VHL09_13705 [Dehalococcoidia bacterium]|nr:hypothetical protein [Dehalococcoidia bacterium]